MCGDQIEIPICLTWIFSNKLSKISNLSMDFAIYRLKNIRGLNVYIVIEIEPYILSEHVKNCLQAWLLIFSFLTKFNVLLILLHLY